MAIFYQFNSVLEEYDKKFKKLNVDYKKRDDLINEQKKLIEDRNRSIKTLEERIRTLEKKYDADIASRENLLKQQKLQIDNQSLQIAKLTYQLHNLRNNRSDETSSEVDTESRKKIKSPKVGKNFLRSKDEVGNSELNSRKNSRNEKIEEANESEFVKIVESSANCSQANSPRSRSTTPPVQLPQKVLPPVIKRVSEVIPPPDPKPFLLSAASTLHSRNRKDYLQRKALISLPPIKPFEINHLVVESPLKIGPKNSNFVQNFDKDQNNSLN